MNIKNWEYVKFVALKKWNKYTERSCQKKNDSLKGTGILDNQHHATDAQLSLAMLLKRGNNKATGQNRNHNAAMQPIICEPHHL